MGVVRYYRRLRFVAMPKVVSTVAMRKKLPITDPGR